MLMYRFRRADSRVAGCPGIWMVTVLFKCLARTALQPIWRFQFPCAAHRSGCSWATTACRRTTSPRCCTRCPRHRRSSRDDAVACRTSLWAGWGCRHHWGCLRKGSWGCLEACQVWSRREVERRGQWLEVAVTSRSLFGSTPPRINYEFSFPSLELQHLERKGKNSNFWTLNFTFLPLWTNFSVKKFFLNVAK